MLDYIEVHKVDPDFDWIELQGADEHHEEPVIIRLVVGDAREMGQNFVKRYLAKRDRALTIPDSQLRLVEEFLEEARMAHVLIEAGNATSELIELIPTTTIHFKYPEKTSFRRSRAARIKMFINETYEHLKRREFEAAFHRLNWVHLLDPENEHAFELKVVCLRSWRKMAECVPVFEAWAKAHPDELAPRLGLGELWLYLEQNQRAKETFSHLLERVPKNAMALVGLAQAKLKLGENPETELRTVQVLDAAYAKEMVENHFDFRGAHPRDLAPTSLMDIAKSFQIPIQRVLERAKRGVLPMHPPEGDGLLRFSQKELKRHYEILKMLGLEIASQTLAKENPEPESYQPGLFDGIED